MEQSRHISPKKTYHPLMMPHAIMMVLCIVNFDIMRNLKESLLITRLGAEIIPFVKLWVVVPAAFIFLVSYSYLANRLSKRSLFFCTIAPFLIWMLVFSQIIYPNLDGFAASTLSRLLEPILPDNLAFISGLIYFWPITLFFTLAELWGSAIICIIFWTAVNDVNSPQTAEVSYPFITLMGNSASVISGPILLYITTHNAHSELVGLQHSVSQMSFLFLLCGILFMVMFEYCLRKSSQYSKSTHHSGHSSQSTTHLPLIETFRYLAKSRYLRCVALMVLSYCIAINTLEVAWKSQLLKIYPTEIEYSQFMSKFTMFMGAGCLFCGLILPKLISRGWNVAAMATPVIMSATAIPFFIITLLLNTRQVQLLDYFSINLLMIAVVLGMFSNVLSRSAKYTMFDATKEMTFVPLDREQKYKGKAAIELVVSRLGKSGSAFLQQVLILWLGSLTLAMPWLMAIFIVIFGLWLYSIQALHSQYNQLVAGEKRKTNNEQQEK